MNSDASGPADPRDQHEPDESLDPTNDADSDDFESSGGEQTAIPDEGEDADDRAIVEEYVDPDLQGRLWLKTLIPLLQLRSQETDPNGRVQFALDRMYIAACERIARILGSDLDARS